MRVEPFEVNFAQDGGVGGVKRFERTGDALAGSFFELGTGKNLGLKLFRPAFEGRSFGGSAAIRIDDGVAQDTVEPGDGRLVVAQGITVAKSAHVGGLEDVFGERAVVDAALDEAEELGAEFEQRVECGFGHKVSAGRSQAYCLRIGCGTGGFGSFRVISGGRSRGNCSPDRRDRRGHKGTG